MVSFFPARSPGTRAGKNDDVRMLKGKLPQMNHFLIHFDCYLQRFCPKRVFFGAKHNLKTSIRRLVRGAERVRGVRGMVSFFPARRPGTRAATKMMAFVC